MNAAEKKILTAFLGKTSNIPAETFASLFTKKEDETEELNDKALDILLNDHAETVKTAKANEKLLFDNGYKKAQIEVLSKLEKDLSEKFEFKSDKKGLELIEEIVISKTKAPELDEDKVKIHPLFIKTEKESAKKIKELEESFKTKFEEREKELAREQTFNTVTKKATDLLKTFKPIFGTADEAKIQNQIERLLMGDIKSYEFLDQNGELIVMKEGKRLEDLHGKPISFEALIKENAAKHWDFEEVTGRAGAGANNDEAAKAAAAKLAGKKYKGDIPKTEEEFGRVFPTIIDPEQRAAFVDEYEAQFAAK